MYYVLNEDDSIPLPGSEVHIDIPLDRVGDFKTNGVNGEQQIVVLMCREPTDSNWEIMKDLVLLKESTLRTGILCNVTLREDSENFQLVTLVGKSIVSIKDHFEVSDGLQIEYEEIPREIGTDHYLYWDVITLMSILIDSESSEITPAMKDVLEGVKGRSVIEIMDKLAGMFIPVWNDASRTKYITIARDLERQWALVQDHILAKVQKKEFKEFQEKKEEELIVSLKDALNDIFSNSGFTNTDYTIKESKIKIPKQVAKDDYAGRLKQLNISEKHREFLEGEIKKYDQLPKSSQDKYVLQTYLEIVLDLPWGQTEYQELPFNTLRRQLNESHYGLDEVKDHIVEHMVIERRTGGASGTVLCFSGPPGTGKTSIAKSIAKATGRTLVPIALGGLGDEAELRGHRRTYVGAKPGRIIEGLKQAKTSDVLFLLDEVDKIHRFKGDPMAALLEILDPEQNGNFVDKYVELPFDLSKAMFICTANEESDIHDALMDRMEFIRFRNYSEEERTVITSKYLIPKVMKRYNITDTEVSFTQDAIEYIVEEPQLRQIEKRVAKGLRKAAVELDLNGAEFVEINKDFLTNKIEKQPADESKRTIGFHRSNP